MGIGFWFYLSSFCTRRSIYLYTSYTLIRFGFSPFPFCFPLASTFDSSSEHCPKCFVSPSCHLASSFVSTLLLHHSGTVPFCPMLVSCVWTVPFCAPSPQVAHECQYSFCVFAHCVHCCCPRLCPCHHLFIVPRLRCRRCLFSFHRCLFSFHPSRHCCSLSLGARGYLPGRYMVSSLLVLKQFAQPIPPGYMLSTL
jgi:hypothetical protein